ncbi:MerR family transcriptional regulator [Microbacterium sp. CPCC 204701]|uniref:MerR family transcriptional regulator n=1 Tax=Microbacterium sp. CPCC 204701 TaxID=2493084 RepID=UPI0013E2B8D9|nr:MerR family DNA-binding transcriptional regulator [Microbacterium sp. CPCC 204701]
MIGALDDLIRIGEAARLLNVHPQTLRYWGAKGWITAGRTPGGERRFRRSDVLRLIEAPPPLYARMRVAEAHTAAEQAHVVDDCRPVIMALEDLLEDDPEEHGEGVIVGLVRRADGWSCEVRTPNQGPLFAVPVEADDVVGARAAADAALERVGLRTVGWHALGHGMWAAGVERVEAVAG